MDAIIKAYLRAGMPLGDQVTSEDIADWAAERMAKARQEIKRLRREIVVLRKEEPTWVRLRLGLPKDTPFSTGDGPTLCGTLNVICSDAFGYRTYIAAHKCGDKEGQIARQAVEIERLRERVDELERLDIARRIALEGDLEVGAGRPQVAPKREQHPNQKQHDKPSTNPV